MKKRLVAMLLVVALSVGLLASTVSAAGIFEPSHMFGNIVHAQLEDLHHCGKYTCPHTVCACGKHYSCVYHSCTSHVCGTLTCTTHSKCSVVGCTKPSCVPHTHEKPGCTIPGCVHPICTKPGCTSHYTCTDPKCPIAHEVKFVTDGGTLYAPVKVYEHGDFLLYSYVPTKVGYTFGGWYYDIGCTKPVVDFKPTCDTTLYAKWLAEYGAFQDVPANSYFYNATCWANKCGVLPTAQFFNPNQACTRADMITFLWRAAGSPQSKLTYMPFSDVSEKAVCYEAVKWALEKGITKGTNNLMFRPYETVTRAEVITFLYRYAGVTTTAANPYTDVAEGDWFFDAVRWADSQKITNGTNNLMFRPYDECTRAQVLTFLHRYFS